MKKVLLFVLPAFWLSASSASLANDRPDSANNGEKTAICNQAAEEFSKLAAKGAWSGAEAKYMILVDTKCSITAAQYALGGQSALRNGNPGVARARFALAGALGAADVADIDKRFSSVKIEKQRKGTTIVAMTSGPNQVDTLYPPSVIAIAEANRVLADKRTFEGWLPVGTYQIGGAFFEVKVGPQLVVKKAPEASERP